MTSIYINNELVPLPENASIDTVLKQQGYVGSFAVALNRQFIPRTQHISTFLNAGDKIEIIIPMQGG